MQVSPPTGGEVKPITALPCRKMSRQQREDADSHNSPEGHRGIISSEKGPLQEATDWFHPPGYFEMQNCRNQGSGLWREASDNLWLQALWWLFRSWLPGSHEHAHLTELHAYMHHITVVVSRSRWGRRWVLLSWLWGCFIVRCLPGQSWGGPADLQTLP